MWSRWSQGAGALGQTELVSYTVSESSLANLRWKQKARAQDRQPGLGVVLETRQ